MSKLSLIYLQGQVGGPASKFSLSVRLIYFILFYLSFFQRSKGRSLSYIEYLLKWAVAQVTYLPVGSRKTTWASECFHSQTDLHKRRGCHSK